MPETRKFFLETHGCQMNFSDSEIITAILYNAGYGITANPHEADVILMNTCSIRDNAEQKARRRLTDFKYLKKKNPSLIVGVLGCMAERMKTKMLEEDDLVDVVVGPDAYRSLPQLLCEAEDGQKAANVLLSREETYADINPVRLSGNGVTAFISIARGCNNMCSFCVVPFTRGRERSRNPDTIVNEAKTLFDKGYREVTLLGQNVDSYLWKPGNSAEITINFALLLEMVAKVNPLLRIRFTTSNPQDMTDEVLQTMKKHDNVCRYIHLPVQSGSSTILKRMNRGYDRSTYLDRIRTIKEIIPGCGISTDIISGFCSETEDDHLQTLSLMEEVRFDYGYMFSYSERPGTLAARKYADDVPHEIKQRRLEEIVALHRRHSHQSNLADVGKEFEVLIEGTSKKSAEELYGRNSQNKVIVFPNPIGVCKGGVGCKPGDYVKVKVNGCTSGTLIGVIKN